MDSVCILFFPIRQHHPEVKDDVFIACIMKLYPKSRSWRLLRKRELKTAILRTILGENDAALGDYQANTNEGL